MYVFISKDKTVVKSFRAAGIRLALVKFQARVKLPDREFLDLYGAWLCYSETTISDLLFIDTVENLF